MKKTLKRVFAVLVVAALLFTSFGCGAKYKDSKYVGTWVATTASYAGYDMSVKSLFGKFELKLEEDGTCIVNVKGEETEGEWEETDKGIKILGGSTGDLEIPASGKKLVMTYSGVKIIFEKK